MSWQTQASLSNKSKTPSALQQIGTHPARKAFIIFSVTQNEWFMFSIAKQNLQRHSGTKAVHQ